MTGRSGRFSWPDLPTFVSMEGRAASYKPSLLLAVMQNKCPRCRRGPMFRHRNPYDLRRFMRMNERCPVCTQPLDMEPGFYYGTNMISYALAVLFSAFTFAAWWFLIGFSLSDSRFFWWMGLNALLLVLLQPPLMRLSRTVWIYFFVRYSPDWEKGDIIESERVNKDQMNAW
jgi:uncharacterized protein (DUF983 family)